MAYYAARYNLDLDLITRGSGFGYYGSVVTNVIFATFTFIFFALEGSIMAQGLVAAARRVRDGQPHRQYRGFFCDLIEFEWIEAKFDPRRVLSLPLSLRAQMKPNPRIIDDAS